MVMVFASVKMGEDPKIALVARDFLKLSGGVVSVQFEYDDDAVMRVIITKKNGSKFDGVFDRFEESEMWRGIERAFDAVAESVPVASCSPYNGPKKTMTLR